MTVHGKLVLEFDNEDVHNLYAVLLDVEKSGQYTQNSRIAIANALEGLASLAALESAKTTVHKTLPLPTLTMPVRKRASVENLFLDARGLDTDKLIQLIARLSADLAGREIVIEDDDEEVPYLSSKELDGMNYKKLKSVATSLGIKLPVEPTEQEMKTAILKEAR